VGYHGKEYDAVCVRNVLQKVGKLQKHVREVDTDIDTGSDHLAPCGEED
jgi:hypothetical protein